PTADYARSTGFDKVLLDDGVQSTDPYSDYVKWRNQHDPQRAVPYLQTMDVPAGKNPFRGVIDYRFTPTAWTGEQGVQMLRELAVSSRPFFLHVSFFKPHSPYTVPEPWDAMYDDFLIPLPKQVSLEQIKELPLPVQRQILRGRPTYEIDRQRLQWIYRSYYASVSMVDREIGLILDELDRSGKAEHTIVVFTTDHGDQLLEHGLEGKNLFFESSVHVPYMIRYPWHVKPARYNTLVETIDTVPTLLEFCGLPIPIRVEGRSLAPLIAREAFPRKYAARDRVFSENIIPEVITNAGLDFSFTPGVGIKDIRHPDSKMVRTRRWKLNYYPGNDGELYDMENDPDETRNLIASPEHQKQVQELKASILDWMITADEASQIAPRWRIP
ncbi:MAG: sulfatase-like hydrolase/transferase, partial [Bryobacteraceae bacterium]